MFDQINFEMVLIPKLILHEAKLTRFELLYHIIVQVLCTWYMEIICKTGLFFCLYPLLNEGKLALWVLTDLNKFYWR